MKPKHTLTIVAAATATARVVGRTITVSASAYNARGKVRGLQGTKLSYGGRKLKLSGPSTRVKLTGPGR